VLVLAARERDPGYWGFPLWLHAFSSQHRNLAVVTSHPVGGSFQHVAHEPHVREPRAHPEFPISGGGGAEPEAIYNLRLILKIML
jgi:hypothetical protein